VGGTGSTTAVGGTGSTTAVGGTGSTTAVGGTGPTAMPGGAGSTAAVGGAGSTATPGGTGPAAAPGGAGSVIVVLATDAPLLPGQCKALARRAAMGIARTGTTGSHFSGDIFLAFSTANPGASASRFPDGSEAYDSLTFVPWGRIDPFYEAAARSVEEAVLNALIVNEDMVGYQGRHVPALPHDRLRDLLAR
jgi:L-aminopeptidase/D-esterase-like protein